MHERCAHGAAAEVGGARGVGVLCGCEGSPPARGPASFACHFISLSWCVCKCIGWAGLGGRGRGAEGTVLALARSRINLVCLCVCVCVGRGPKCEDGKSD